MDERRNRGGALWTTLALLVAGVLYTLSIGPISLLDEQDMLSEATIQWLRMFYFPFIFLWEHQDIPVLPLLLESYCEWWRALGRP